MSKTHTLKLDIVSLEESIYQGTVLAVNAAGEQGELGIYPGHTPLLTTLRPGPVRVLLEQNEEDVFYISGGFLEVQPDTVTILADTAVRADDIDEAAALEAKKRAEAMLADKQSAFDYSRAAAELAQAAAQIRALKRVRKNK